MPFDLVEHYRDKNWRVVRGALSKIKDAERQMEDTGTRDAIKYFDRDGEYELLHDMYKKRHATRIDPGETNVDGVTTKPTAYTNEMSAAAIDAGLYPTVPIGIGNRICKAGATVTTAQDAYWGYVDTSQIDSETQKAKDAEDAQALMSSIREHGGFDARFEALDFAAVAVELSYFHVFLKGSRVCYDTVLPYDLYCVYGDTVTEHYTDETGAEKEVTRATDYDDIDDAAVVIIHMASNKGDYDTKVDQESYLAYVGANTEYPNGRMVTYLAQNAWPVPEVGADSITSEYVWTGAGADGKPCNPLTWIQNSEDKDAAKLVSSEYPIIPWKGGNRTIGTGRGAVTTSLYDACIELELSWNRLLDAALKNARGVNVVNMGDSMKVPQSLIDVVLQENQTFNKIWGGAGELQAGTEFLTVVTKQVAGSYNVPGYMVLDHGGIPESGIALAIQSKPLSDFRLRRINLNRAGVNAIFDAERALMATMNPSTTVKLLGPTIEQQWNPGTWNVPKDEASRLAELVAARDAEAIDHVEFIRRYHKLATTKEAAALVETYTERDPDYGKEPEPEKPQGFGF